MLRPAGLAAVVAATAVAGLASATPAWAHAEVKATSPQAGSNVHGTLTRISVTFTEAVTLVPHALRLTTDAGIPVNLETPHLSSGGTVLAANVQDRLASGRYAVAWRVQADDGHLEASTFSFAVSASTRPSATGTAETTPPPAPNEPLWPVLVAAGIALAGGIAAGVAVRRGLSLVRAAPLPTDQHGGSPAEHDSLRLPM